VAEGDVTGYGPRVFKECHVHLGLNEICKILVKSSAVCVRTREPGINIAVLMAVGIPRILLSAVIINNIYDNNAKTVSTFALTSPELLFEIKRRQIHFFA
jgi:hypothetical protein